jgi:hypothetical protein
LPVYPKEGLFVCCLFVCLGVNKASQEGALQRHPGIELSFNIPMYGGYDLGCHWRFPFYLRRDFHPFSRARITEGCQGFVGFCVSKHNRKCSLVFVLFLNGMSTTPSVCQATCRVALLLVLLLAPECEASVNSPLQGHVAVLARQVRWWTNFENDPNNEEEMLELFAAHPRAITGIYTYIGAGQGDSGSFNFGHSPATENNITWIREKVAVFTRLGLTVIFKQPFTD